MTAALIHFKKCDDISDTSLVIYEAMAFKTHLANDPEWPRANKVFHPDSAVSQK
jgi:hypothetical protein